MDSFDKMIAQLVDLMQDKEKYVDKDDPDDIIAKDVKALHYAIDLLKYQKHKMEEYKNEKLLLSQKLDEKEEKIQIYENLIYDYRKMVDLLTRKED